MKEEKKFFSFSFLLRKTLFFFPILFDFLYLGEVLVLFLRDGAKIIFNRKSIPTISLYGTPAN